MNKRTIRPDQRLSAWAWRLVRDTRVAAAAVFALVGLYSLGLAAFIRQYSVNTVSRDEWRFIDLLRDYYAGSLSLADFWATHSQHRVPAYKLYFLLNALWCNLDVRLGSYLGVFALMGFSLLLYRHFLRARPGGVASGVDHYAFIPVALVVLGWVQNYSLSYDLIAIMAVCGMLVFCAIWVFIDTHMRGSVSHARLALLAAIMCAALLLFGAAKGPAIVVATLAMCLLLAFITRGVHPGRFRLTAWMLTGCLAAQAAYWAVGSELVKGPGLAQRLATVFSNLPGAAGYVLRAIGASALLPDPTSSPETASRALFCAGIAVSAAGLAAAVLYFRTGAYRRSLIPFVLVVCAALYLAELLVGRFGQGENNGGAPRYIYNDHLLLIACALVFADVGRNWVRGGQLRRGIALLAALTLCVASMEFVNVERARQVNHFEKRATEAAVGIARARLDGASTPYPKWYCPDAQLCDEGATFLRLHGLNAFAPSSK